MMSFGKLPPVHFQSLRNPSVVTSQLPLRVAASLGLNSPQTFKLSQEDMSALSQKWLQEVQEPILSKRKPTEYRKHPLKLGLPANNYLGFEIKFPDGEINLLSRWEKGNQRVYELRSLDSEEAMVFEPGRLHQPESPEGPVRFKIGSQVFPCRDPETLQRITKVITILEQRGALEVPLSLLWQQGRLDDWNPLKPFQAKMLQQAGR